MTRYVILLLGSLLAARLCVMQAAASDSFSLWDAGCYLSALGIVLGVRRIFPGLSRQQSDAAHDP